jgi:gliding motility-associated-like protein
MRHFKIACPLNRKLLFSFITGMFLTFTVNAQLPTGTITYNYLSKNCAGVSVSFTANSGNATGFAWSASSPSVIFTNTSLSNTTATFTAAGTFTITLVLSNASGNSAPIQQSMTINPNPVPNFSANPTSGCFPLNVQFTDLSSAGGFGATISSELWDPGTGTFYTSAPAVTYKNATNPNITLIVTNNFGCQSDTTKKNYIQVSPGVTANFGTVITTSCKPPTQVNFSSSSTGPPTLSYTWKFGDGNTSSTGNVNISHIYTSASTYTVTLIASSTAGCTDSMTTQVPITASTVQTNFTMPDSVCVGSPVSFLNSSNPPPGSSAWKYGDGNSSSSFNGSNAYAAAGTYTITLTNNYGTCSDSANKSIVVVNPPTANFTAVGKTVGCKPPLTVQFQDQSTGANSWFWNFGDGSNSNARNPIHTYSSYGQFDVTLVASSASGCSSTKLMPQFVKIDSPTVIITNLPAFGCAPVVYSPTYSVSAVDGVANYFWNFGNGFMFNGPNPTPPQSYSAGKWPVSLTITTTGGCTTSYVDTVHVGTVKPTPNFSAVPTTVCRSTPVQFKDLSGGAPNQWFWEFGDGGTSTVQDPLYTYTKPGMFNVTLIVYNNGCQDSLTLGNLITVNPPLSRFNFSFGCASNIVLFRDSSIGADQWIWDYGDGTAKYIGSPANPAQPGGHPYATPGNYHVTLVVINNGSGCHDTSTQVVAFSPKFVLTVLNPSVCKNTNALFSTLNYGNIASYVYNFGDGSPLLGPVPNPGGSPVHAYAQPGIYRAVLTATLTNGCVGSSIAMVTVNGPTAGFSVNDTLSCGPLNAVFTDTSKSDGMSNIANWAWNFGDGTSVTGPTANQTHPYPNQGIFSVNLKITDASGCSDSVSKSNYVTVSIIHAKFSSPDSTCPGATVSFIDSTTGGFNPNYNWNFGNGQTSSSFSPPGQTYSSIGTSLIKLIVSDSYGCADSMKTNIVVNSPVASFTESDSVSNCPPLQESFTFTGSYYNTLIWNYDGVTIDQDILNPKHIYAIPGTYYPTLTVISPGGCSATATDTVTIYGPQLNSFAYAPTGGCDTLTVNFSVGTSKGVTKYVWNFADGSSPVTTDTPTVSHFYTAPANYQGSYLPTVTLTNDSGCTVTYDNLKDTITVVKLKAQFLVSKLAGCVDSILHFQDQTKTNGTIINYFWDFGDGQTLNGLFPDTSHVYLSPGFYTAKLVITTQYGCQDSVFNQVKVVTNPAVDITGAISSCVPATLSFNGVVLVPDTSALTWTWNFYNGQPPTIGNPPAPQIYTKPGNYPVQLVATNSTGCSDTANNSFLVYPLPNIFAGNDTTICLGASLVLQATGANTYNWLAPSNSSLSCSVCANPTATPTVTTSYIVNGTSVNGCQAQDTIQVTVNQPVTVSVNPLDSICIGQSVQLTASGAAIYSWTPAASLSNPNIANPLASPGATTTYQVIGSDNKFCFYDTEYVKVMVFNYPTVNAGPDVTILVGSSYQINATGSADIVSINWLPVSGLSCSNCLTPLATPQSTTDYIVDVSNNGGCQASDSIKITVICNNNNIFVPNTFSPNGDGVNDIFYVRGKGLSTIPSITIFNRWGQIVFQKKDFAPNDPTAGWDGTFNGKPAPIDVYIYTIDIICDNSSLIPYHGNVALIR